MYNTVLHDVKRFLIYKKIFYKILQTLNILQIIIKRILCNKKLHLFNGNWKNDELTIWYSLKKV